MTYQEDIAVREVSGRAELRSFIRLPYVLHRGHPEWVPPLLRDEYRQFNRRKNRAFTYSDGTLVLAYRGQLACGRILGIVNRRDNLRRGQRTARFGYLECSEDRSVASALLGHVEQWAMARGADMIVGPMGFTDQDPEGFLIEGFNHEPTIATYANMPYMPRLVEDCGYTKEVDYVVYKVKVPQSIPESYERISHRILSGGEFKVIEFQRRRELRPYIRRVLSLMNETFAELYGYTVLDDFEMEDLAKKYWLLLDPRFVKFATKSGRDVAFMIAMPNVDPGLRKARGRLFPFGLLYILRSARKSRQLDLLVAGIKEEGRARGLGVVGMTAMMRSARTAGFEVMDSHLELETNTRVRAEMERLGGTACKRYRVFQKKLT
jgi:hypothetical protein